MTTKTLACALALALIVAATAATGAQARTRHQEQFAPVFDRHAIHTSGSEAAIGEPSVRRIKTAGVKQVRRKHERRYRERPSVPRNYADRSRTRPAIASHKPQIVAHPPGCPSRAFCGCGASIEVFGKSIRELWLAANWFKFPRTAPAPGMVAVRRHHVFVIREVRGPGLVLAYDANSGGHKTRIHLRRLSGYVVVNPRGSRYANAG